MDPQRAQTKQKQSQKQILIAGAWDSFRALSFTFGEGVSLIPLYGSVPKKRGILCWLFAFSWHMKGELKLQVDAFRLQLQYCKS